ncbi:MAG TPA: hypothetical protein VF458_00385 [Ktedonobacteraceae bacterium]
MQPLVSFDWLEGRSKQLAYISQDHHIHEFHVGTGGMWQHTDLSMLASAPLATSRFLVGYTCPQTGTKQIAYLGPDGHIHELQVSVGGSWQHTNLSVLAGAPPAIQVTAGYSWNAGNTRQIVFVGDDAHLHELYQEAGRPWRHIDLTALTNAPLPGSHHMVGYEWTERCSKQLVYVGRDGHLHELFLQVGGIWEHCDLTALTNAPRTIDLTVGYEWRDGRCQQIAFVSEDGHIHELYMTAGQTWQHADLSAITGASPAMNVMTGYAWDSGHSKQIAYLGRDGRIHELYVEAGKTWQHVDLSMLAQAPMTQVTSLAGCAWSAGDSKQVTYVGNDGDVRELWMPRHSDWKATDLSRIVMAVPARF